jgi:antitoxin HicB
MADNKYLVEVFWSEEDGGYFAIAPDLPGCCAYGDTSVEAVQEMDTAIVAWLNAWTTMGREPPKPASKPRQVAIA